jgi:membrane protein YqaA with SNARE-associated domain
MLATTYFALAVLSAIVPWVNGELLMLSAVPVAATSAQLAGLVVVVTVGQMVGKSVMYWLSRGATSRRIPRLEAAIARWRGRFEGRLASALGITLVSSAVGFPPFYLVSIAAGALNVPFAPFLIVGTIGRLVHFATVALIPYVAGTAV